MILQTVPPFNYSEENTIKWNEVNSYIKTVLADKVDILFDNSDILGMDNEHLHMARYGGHPNAEGCRVWADGLYDAVKDFFQKEQL